jgi:hypothetical protein
LAPGVRRATQQISAAAVGMERIEETENKPKIAPRIRNSHAMRLDPVFMETST